MVYHVLTRALGIQPLSLVYIVKILYSVHSNSSQQFPGSAKPICKISVKRFNMCHDQSPVQALQGFGIKKRKKRSVTNPRKN